MTSMCVALVGNPNGGKTTLFNALTGAGQRVGNWPGVTVERVSGYFTQAGVTVEVVDLPGTYSLDQCAAGSIDESVTCDFIHSKQADLIINIVDASHLERHLYLTKQLLETGAPVIVALNMMDVARVRHIKIDVDRLARELGCPVVPIEAHRGVCLSELRERVIGILPQAEKNSLPQPTCDSEKDSIAIASERYRSIEQLLQHCVVQQSKNKVTWTKRIDDIVLNRVLGIPIFLVMMYGLFAFAIQVGGFFQQYFDHASQVVFVDGVTSLLTAWHAPQALIALLANGVGKGLNTVITFIPVIGAMFFFLAFLEDSGYMARAAFVVDRVMRALGLPGKAFVPMIVGFGCNVPAVMAARNLEYKRDRILTVMMTPFMSCGARLAIYAVFTAAFFPHGGQNVVFGLYVIGIVMAVLTGFLLQRTVLKGEPAPLLMELPSYHLPNLRSVCMHTWQRLRGFVFRAGKLIVPICVLIGTLNTIHFHSSYSLLSVVGQWITPIFSPMGIQSSNWPATVGLMTGVLAKEVVVGTLNTLYAQMETYGSMYQQFDGQIGAFAYLLFVLLYFPCVSTMAVMLRELHRGWTVFSAIWMVGVAYGISVIFYQIATCLRHPISSSFWVAAILAGFVLTVVGLRWLTANRTQKLAMTPLGECMRASACASKCYNCPSLSTETYK